MKYIYTKISINKILLEIAWHSTKIQYVIPSCCMVKSDDEYGPVAAPSIGQGVLGHSEFYLYIARCNLLTTYIYFLKLT